jgi:hypothetical protein
MSRVKDLLNRFYEASSLNNNGELPTAPNPDAKVNGKNKKKNIDNTVVVVEDDQGNTTKVDDTASELQMGLEVEKEHKQTLIRLARMLKPDISQEDLDQFISDGIEMIATDHIKEFDKYYSEFLKKLEDFLAKQE